MRILAAIAVTALAVGASGLWQGGAADAARGVRAVEAAGQPAWQR